MTGNIYRTRETICWGQDGLIFCDTPLSEKCVSRNADSILISCWQRRRNLAFPRVLMARLHAERANKKIRWNRLITGPRERSQVAGEEVITRYQGKGLRGGGSRWAKAKKGLGRPRGSGVPNRIIAFLLLASWLSHCSAGPGGGGGEDLL